MGKCVNSCKKILPRALSWLLSFVPVMTLVALGGCEKANSIPGPQPAAAAPTDPTTEVAREQLAELFGGPDQLLTVRNPSRVIGMKFGSPPIYELRSDLTKYEQMGEPLELGPLLQQEFSDLLLNPDYYLWEVDKGPCGSSGGVMFHLRFVRDLPDQPGADTVDVGFDPACMLILIFEDGKLVREEDFDHGIDAMRETLQKLALAFREAKQNPAE